MRQILLLRGINLGAHKRISMLELRRALEREGFADVRTYLQSGNVVVSSDAPADELAAQARQALARRFGLDVDVIVRTRDELAEVIARDPLGDVAVNPKRYQVSFLARELDAAALRQLSAQAAACWAGLAAWKRNERPPRSTCASASPAPSRRSRSSSGATGTSVSPMCSTRNASPVARLSVPANTPPGRSTRETSPSSLSCSSREGRWWSMVKATTPEKRPSSNGIAVASPCTTSTRSPSSARSRSQ